MDAVRRSIKLALLAGVLGSTVLTACKFPLNSGTKANIGSKGLWIANGSNVVEYNPTQLGAGMAATAPHVMINSAIFGTPRGVAFDPNGNLWVIDPAADVDGTTEPALIEFSAAQLAALATDNAPIPVAVITSTFMKTPQQAVIDALGTAWITDPGAGAVLAYTSTQLAETGSNKVDPVLFITSGQFNGPSGIAFDSTGNLYISNVGTPATTAAAAVAGTTLVEIKAAHVPALPESGTTTSVVVSDVTLTDNGQNSIQSPWALALDSASGVWLSNSTTSTVVGFAQSQLATGTPAPVVALSSATESNVASISVPHGICFDDVGNLAVISNGGSVSSPTLAIFSSAQQTSGSPTPVTLITAGTSLNEPEGCTYGPVVQ